MVGGLLHRWFGVGRIPAEEWKVLQSEGVGVSFLGRPGSVTLRHCRAPGRYHSWKRHWFVGSLVVTSRRVVAYSYSRRLLSIGLDDPELGEWDIHSRGRRRLCMVRDAAGVPPFQSGTIEIRFKIPGAEQVAALLRRGERGALVRP